MKSAKTWKRSAETEVHGQRQKCTRTVVTVVPWGALTRLCFERAPDVHLQLRQASAEVAKLMLGERGEEGGKSTARERERESSRVT